MDIACCEDVTASLSMLSSGVVRTCVFDSVASLCLRRTIFNFIFARLLATRTTVALGEIGPITTGEGTAIDRRLAGFRLWVTCRAGYYGWLGRQRDSEGRDGWVQRIQ